MSTWSRTLGWSVAVLIPSFGSVALQDFGSEVLTPVVASGGGKTLKIYVATTREHEISSGNVFTANLANGLNFAKFTVSVPPNHKPGNIEMPTGIPDPASSFAVVDQAALSEADFRKTCRSSRQCSAEKAQSLRFRARVQQYLSRVTVPNRATASGHQDRRNSDPVRVATARSVGAYEMDKQSANNSRDYLMALLTMRSATLWWWPTAWVPC